MCIASHFRVLLLCLICFHCVSITTASFVDTFLLLKNGSQYSLPGVTTIEFIRDDPSLLLFGTIGGSVALIRINQNQPTHYTFVKTLQEISVGAGRSVLGISSDPFLPHIYYISTSSFRWRQQGFPESGWQNGKVERLLYFSRTKAISVVGSIAEGLPVSLGNGAVYGTAVDSFTSNLYVSVGTFNNGGVPSEFEGNLSDCIYSGTILEVDMKSANVSRRLEWTSDDPAAARLKQTPEQSGISVYAEGIRSAFTLTVSTTGELLLFGGGANAGRGPQSISCTESAPISVPEPDKIIRVERGRFYGHPNRANDRCVFVSSLISQEEARALVPDITFPLFTTQEAIEKKIVIGSPTGSLEYTPAWFPSLRGLLMGIEEPPISGREGVPGTAAYNLQTGEITRVADLTGVNARIDAYGSMFAADFEGMRIKIAVPKVTKRMKRKSAVRAVWPSRGLRGSKVYIAVTGIYSRRVRFGRKRGYCERQVRRIGGVRLLTCYVPFSSFPKKLVSVQVGWQRLRKAFMVL
ncbi:hypothetical protein BWQ96_03719 [Gracilariopsis chorda]|uniref:Uncharacterized protein n=1 Tax=Gracilariopsis chorda TaxID=448386 RepID=A0A2V3IWG0_9FLOR|nr:hypothetical protein BWQ96_03719 [Gracilariopsis chorda]|eukprot:PXF46484.1 hypothetical protein BWQ96_03719 [Gracilariopsis chorda]